MGVSWHACMSADMLGVHIYYMAIDWHACSGGAYMSADMLEHAYIIGLSAGTLAATKHICRLTRLEHAYIIWPSAGMLAVGAHICWLTHLEHAYII